MSENTEEDKPITLIQQDEKHKKIKESLKNVTCPC